MDINTVFCRHLWYSNPRGFLATPAAAIPEDSLYRRFLIMAPLGIQKSMNGTSETPLDFKT